MIHQREVCRMLPEFATDFVSIAEDPDVIMVEKWRVLRHQCSHYSG